LQKVKDLDEALKALKDALAIAINAKQYDVTLLCLGALSGLENIDKITQLNYLKQAYVIIDKHKNVNDYYKKDFYYHELDFYKKEKNFEQENEIRKKLASIEENKKVKELDYLIKQYDEVIQKTEDNLVLEKANSEKSRQLQYL